MSVISAHVLDFNRLNFSIKVNLKELSFNLISKVYALMRLIIALFYLTSHKNHLTFEYFHTQRIFSGEAQMWHILAYMSYIPDTRIWTGIILFMCIFVLLNIFVSRFNFFFLRLFDAFSIHLFDFSTCS